MKYAHLKIAEAQAYIVALDRDVAVLASALESCDQADRKLITEAMETITAERRRAYSNSRTCFGTPLELTASVGRGSFTIRGLRSSTCREAMAKSLIPFFV
jgi:hypothetical protein